MPPSVAPSRASTGGSDSYLVHKPPHNYQHRHTVAGSSPAAKDEPACRSFVQVKSRHEHVELELVDVWATVIPAKIATSVVSYLKEKLPTEPCSLLHLRRLVKLEVESSSQVLLSLLICSVQALPSENDVREVLAPIRKQLPDDVNSEDVLRPVVRQAPRYPALTKEQSQLWSEGTWPIMWRGNPHSIIHELPPQEEALYIKLINKLTELTHKAELAGEVPVAAIIVDPSTYEIMASAADTRNSSGNPLCHSTMACIAKVAETELRRRQMQAIPTQRSYLCHNLHLVTTHEPCAMCSMAMVHSRISRLVYIKTMPRSGGIDRSSGPGYGIHWNKQLNWRFESWRFDGDVALHEVDENINA